MFFLPLQVSFLYIFYLVRMEKAFWSYLKAANGVKWEAGKSSLVSFLYFCIDS